MAVLQFWEDSSDWQASVRKMNFGLPYVSFHMCSGAFDVFTASTPLSHLQPSFHFIYLVHSFCESKSWLESRIALESFFSCLWVECVQHHVASFGNTLLDHHWPRAPQDFHRRLSKSFNKSLAFPRARSYDVRQVHGDDAGGIPHSESGDGERGPRCSRIVMI